MIWYMVWYGMHVMVYGMAWYGEWHSIWFGLAGMACYMLWYGLAGIVWYMVWLGEYVMVYGMRVSHGVRDGLAGLTWYYGMALRASHCTVWRGGHRMVYMVMA